MLTDKGIISRWKFSKLEIAECLCRIDLQLLQGEKTYYLHVDREYSFAIVDAVFKCSTSKKISTRSFVINLESDTKNLSMNQLPSLNNYSYRNLQNNSFLAVE